MQHPFERVELAAALAPKFNRALALLLESAAYARQTNGDSWEFAVEISQLSRLGLCDNDLRFLVRMRFVDHASEVTNFGNCSRAFRPTGDLYFTDRTCFVLTSRGIAAATTIINCPTEAAVVRATGQASSDSEHISPHSPRWDAARRLLIFDGRIIKQFKWQAANQETVLSVFQEEGWPGRIDDPLVPSPNLDVKRRLSDTIKCLNRNRRDNTLQFHGDGTGQGVIWKAVTIAARNPK